MHTKQNLTQSFANILHPAPLPPKKENTSLRTAASPAAPPRSGEAVEL